MSRLQHHTASRARLTSAALGLGAVVALAGCSAGQVTETDTQVSAVSGGSGTVQGLAVRDAMLTFPTGENRYPAGSSAPLRAVLINSGAQGDRLVQVTSTYAGSAQVGGTTQLPAGTALHADGEPSEPESGQPSQGAQPTQPTQPAQGAQQPARSAGGQHEVSITLNGLTRDITPGVTIPVTFVFEKAGPVTVQVPIGPDTAPRPAHDDPGGGHH